MKTTGIRRMRKTLLPFLHSTKNRTLFMMINIYLIIGMSSLIITILYLLVNLSASDQIIKYCIPGFVLGISSAIIYFIGYLGMISEKNKLS